MAKTRVMFRLNTPPMYPKRKVFFNELDIPPLNIAPYLPQGPENLAPGDLVLWQSALSRLRNSRTGVSPDRRAVSASRADIHAQHQRIPPPPGRHRHSHRAVLQGGEVAEEAKGNRHRANPARRLRQAHRQGETQIHGSQTKPRPGVVASNPADPVHRVSGTSGGQGLSFCRRIERFREQAREAPSNPAQNYPPIRANNTRVTRRSSIATTVIRQPSHSWLSPIIGRRSSKLTTSPARV